MNKNLTYKQRLVRIASISIVSFVSMSITAFVAGLGIITNPNTQLLAAFFILATGMVWIASIMSALVAILENWVLKKTEQMKENVK